MKDKKVQEYVVQVRIMAESPEDAEKFIEKSLKFRGLDVGIRGIDGMSRVEEIWDDLENAGDDVWDNLHEFSKEDFMEVYGLTEEDASLIDLVVSSRMDVNRNVMMKRPSRVGTMINESLHQSLDGWTIAQGLVIQAYLSDIAFAVSQIEEDERLSKLRHDPDFDTKYGDVK